MGIFLIVIRLEKQYRYEKMTVVAAVGDRAGIQAFLPFFFVMLIDCKTIHN
jgi:hypothetical protein